MLTALFLSFFQKRGIEEVQKIEKQESRPATPVDTASAKRSSKKKKT